MPRTIPFSAGALVLAVALSGCANTQMAGGGNKKTAQTQERDDTEADSVGDKVGSGSGTGTGTGTGEAGIDDEGDTNAAKEGEVIDEFPLEDSKSRPVDIVLVMDTSGSMGDKKSRVEQSMSAFIAALTKAKIDAQFVIIGRGFNFGSSAPSKGFSVVQESVDGPDVFEKLLKYVNGQFSGALPLRKGAVLEAIGITDRDASGVMGSSVQAALKGRDFHFSAVVGQSGSNSCRVISKGVKFSQTAQATGGLNLDLCSFDGNILVEQVSKGIIKNSGGSGFELSETPMEDGVIEVKADGKKLGSDSYDVDYDTGKVTLTEDADVGSAKMITVRYKPES